MLINKLPVFPKNSSPEAVRLNNRKLNNSLRPLSHRRSVGDLSIYYRYFNGHCSQEIREIIPVHLRRVRTTRSSTHSHSFQVSLPNPRTLSHKSSFIATYGASCLLLPFPSPQLAFFYFVPNHTKRHMTLAKPRSSSFD